MAYDGGRSAVTLDSLVNDVIRWVLYVRPRLGHEDDQGKSMVVLVMVSSLLPSPLLLVTVIATNMKRSSMPLSPSVHQVVG